MSPKECVTAAAGIAVVSLARSYWCFALFSFADTDPIVLLAVAALLTKPTKNHIYIYIYYYQFMIIVVDIIIVILFIYVQTYMCVYTCIHTYIHTYILHIH